MTPGGVRQGSDRLRGVRGATIGVDLNRAEIAAKARLKELPGRAIERRSRFVKHLMHDGRGLAARLGPLIDLRLSRRIFLLAGSAAQNKLAIRHGAVFNRPRWIGHAQYLIGGAISFGFERIIDRANFKPALHSRSNPRQIPQCGLVPRIAPGGQRLARCAGRNAIHLPRRMGRSRRWGSMEYLLHCTHLAAKRKEPRAILILCVRLPDSQIQCSK
jgi:hypothetical protein